MKKGIYALIASIVQLVIGTLAIVSFVILAADGEDLTKWIPAFLLAIAFVVLGIIGIKEHKSKE